MQASATGAKPHGHEGQTRKELCRKDPWSAPQTHLQGMNWATLAIMPEECRHRAALLSRLSGVKIARLAKESKPKSPPAQLRKPATIDDRVAALR
jgi:hypothetical protein